MRNVDTPVIFITGYGDIESYMDLMNMGAFDYLNKPVGARELLNIVRRVFGNSGAPLNI
jgi:FixJ family two-component response regulator